jgi:hypothetical protein
MVLLDRLAVVFPIRLRDIEFDLTGLGRRTDRVLSGSEPC